MEFEITKLSSKGQIVIPSNLRKGLKEGDKFLIMRQGDKIVLSKASELDKKIKEDIEFAKETEEAWKEIEQGKGVKMGIKEFLEDMKTW